MRIVEKYVDVNVPIGTVYNQWTRFENFPKFMEGVESVTPLDDDRMLWRVAVCGRVEEQEVELVGKIPCESIAWRSASGARSSWLVDFARLEPGRTRIVLHFSYDPEVVGRNAGASSAVPSGRLPYPDLVSARVQADLERFKKLVET